VSSMLWDADSNRVGFTSSTGGTWQFVYDTTAGIPAVIEEVTPSGSVNYIREPYGALIARVAGGSVHYYHFDALGGEINPFDPKSAFSRQAISMGGFAKGNWKSAAANSGWAQLQEAGASPWEFRAYTGTQVVAGVAATGAAAVGVYEAVSGTTVLVEGRLGTRVFQIRPKPGEPWFRLDWGRVPSAGGTDLPHWHQWTDIAKHLPWDWFLKR